MNWFKLHHGITNSPKWASLPDTKRAIYIELLCVASKQTDDKRGTIPVDGLAWNLRRHTNQVRSAIATLLDIGWLEILEGEPEAIRGGCSRGVRGGVLGGPQWVDLQMGSGSSRVRTRKYRERKASQDACDATTPSQHCHGDGTDKSRVDKNITPLTSPPRGEHTQDECEDLEEMVLDIYRGRCIPAGMRAIEGTEDTAKRAIRRRVKKADHFLGDNDSSSLEFWTDYLAYAAQCPYLTGHNSRSRPASLHWLVKPGNMAKVLTMEYEPDIRRRAVAEWTEQTRGGAKSTVDELMEIMCGGHDYGFGGLPSSVLRAMAAGILAPGGSSDD